MTDKYRKAVKKPIQALHKKIKQVAGMDAPTKPKKILKGSALVGMGLVEFMMQIGRVVALDNKLMRRLEKKLSEIQVGKDKDGNEKKFQSFVKRNPNMSAVAIWWAMLGMLIGGGSAIVNNKKSDKKNINTEFVLSDDEIDEEFVAGTYGAYFDNIRTITPFLIADLIAKEGVHTDKNGMHVPYLDSRGVWTIGFGSTMLKDGRRVSQNTHPITNEEAYELARWHLEEGETYFCMYCYDVAYSTIGINDVGQAFAIGSIIYNSYTKLIENPDSKNCKERFAILRQLYKEYGRAVTDEMVINAFNKYPVNDMTSFGTVWLGGDDKSVVADKLGGFLAGGRGLYWRRWLEAGLLTGDVTPQMLLDCPINGVYDFFKCMGQEKSAFFIKDNYGNMRVNRDTYDKFRDWLKNPVSDDGASLAGWACVRDYMPPVALEACDGKVCKLGAKPSKKQIARQKKVARGVYVLNYTMAYGAAVAAYNSGDYESAAKQFEALVAQNPDNALLYNDLAATYNRLGRYDDAILQAQKILRDIGDKSQYAAAQYNAGFAYEHKGDLVRALKNYKLSVANGNKRVAQDVNRVANILNKQKKLHAAVFNDAAAHINSKNKKSDLKNIARLDVATKDYA